MEFLSDNFLSEKGQLEKEIGELVDRFSNKYDMEVDQLDIRVYNFTDGNTVHSVNLEFKSQR